MRNLSKFVDRTGKGAMGLSKWADMLRIDEFCTRHGTVIPVILEIAKVRGSQNSVSNLGYTDDIQSAVRFPIVARLWEMWVKGLFSHARALDGY